MSLNGLDNPAVIEAYQTALAEAGGWFLLNYISRDEIDLLGRGTGGVPEIRVTIEGYEETSPLYGFLQYRRRKVVLRYMPEGLSRLIQARTTVQFQSVLDKFSPHDSVFTLAQPSELTESALSSACLLHAASGSITSSSSSLRRRRLMEITEDAEEGTTGKEETQSESQPPSTRPAVRQRSFSQLSQSTVVPPRNPARAAPSLPEDNNDIDKWSVRELERVMTDDKLPDAVVEQVTEISSPPKHFLEDLSSHSSYEPRKSSQSARPSLRDLEVVATYSSMKVKRAPRPSLDVNGRPRTAGTMTRSNDFRPVASLPAGVRPSSRKSNTDGARPPSQPSPKLPTKRVPPVLPLLVPPPTLPISRPQLSPGAKSMSALSSSGMTPEKERLMKALQLRKKQMEKRAEEMRKKQIAEEKLPVLVDREKQNASQVQDPFLDFEERPKSALTQSEEKENTTEYVQGSQEDHQNDASKRSGGDSESAILPLDSQQTQELALDQNDERDLPRLENTDRQEGKASDATADDFEQPAIESQAAILPETAEISESIEALKEAHPSSPNLSKPDSAVDMMVHDLNQDQSCEETIDSTADTTPIEPVTLLDGDDHPPQVDEAQIEMPAIEESPWQDSQTNPCTDPPSVGAEVPLGNSQQAMEDETSSQPAQVIPDPVGHEEVTTLTIHSETIPLPETSGDKLQSEESAASTSLSPVVDGLGVEEEQPKESTAAPDVSEGPVGQDKPQKQQRKPYLEPIQVPPQDYSDDDNLSSDDSFMEELKSATLEEAKPISVGKTPLSPHFPQGDNDHTSADTWHNTRAVSNPITAGRQTSNLHAAMFVGRSASSSFVDSNGPPVLKPKKITVSSGISKRIQALEKLSSSRDPPTSSIPNISSASNSPSFESLRKRASMSLAAGFPEPPSLSRHVSLAAPSVPANVSARFSTIKRHSSVSTSGPTNAPPTTTQINPEPQPALIGKPLEIPTDTPGPSEEQSLQPIDQAVESENTDAFPSIPGAETENEPVPAISEKRSMSVSSTSSAHGALPPVLSRSNSRLSLSALSKGDDTRSSNPITDLPATPTEEKKESRTSRLLRRMSSLTSNSRKTALRNPSPAVKEDEEEPLPKEEPVSTAPPEVVKAVEIGEVNVQFPDTLLWKRRFMRIDDQGYLVLTSSNVDSSARSLIKRYHLSEFRTPCLPDEDMQELPNSILLDFLDGSTLQCACESRQGQASVLESK
ncbi:hypothetical protein ASPZODRAFT_138101 [Penicilliopsis zonata CBS 506.65]|uniref:ADF-H domain-containing protein n=1 Tax=Penicilliopsis zonata CBS 506.65 TaxID=1073090 RepID=A0A1L9SUV4_9EURO|nr:hypothetical protein ASPZODRAFT_138101 [Penicilliopsis zonata CBS 506.65]OJJ50978.1 hypothetical protein ASPZODRAFT_138101 [Penicilliopsis zonata CBS 506.65]